MRHKFVQSVIRRRHKQKTLFSKCMENRWGYGSVYALVHFRLVNNRFTDEKFLCSC